MATLEWETVVWRGNYHQQEGLDILRAYLSLVLGHSGLG